VASADIVGFGAPRDQACNPSEIGQERLMPSKASDAEKVMVDKTIPKSAKTGSTSTKAAQRTGLMTASPFLADDTEGAGMNPRDHVSSLARGLEVLRAFNRTRRKMTLSEVAAETNNTRAGARRILLTLVHEGYAVADGKLFDLTPQVLELGYSVLSSKGAWEIARPFIDHLSEELRESCSAAVLDKFEVVYVSGAQYHRVLSVGITVGARFPAYCTATGRVLLAAQPEELWPGILQNISLAKLTDRTTTDRTEFRKILEDVRAKGWSLVDQELEIGLMSIAVPLRNSAGGLVGAINVGVPTVRITPAEMESHVLPRLLDTASSISNALKR
jgi:IclR family pca regulon transcriptional regulator